MEKITHKNKGQITVPFGIAIATATMIVSGLTSYFTGQISTQENISVAKSDLKADISDDRQRLAKLEEAISTIKTTNEQTHKDIQEILRIIK